MSNLQQSKNVAVTNTAPLSNHNTLVLVPQHQESEIFDTYSKQSTQIVRWDEEGSLTTVATNVSSIEAVVVVAHGNQLTQRLQTPVELLKNLSAATGQNFDALQFIVLVSCNGCRMDSRSRMEKFERLRHAPLESGTLPAAVRMT